MSNTTVMKLSYTDLTVLARSYVNEVGKNELIPLRYQNQTQAERKILALSLTDAFRNASWYVWRSTAGFGKGPFYIVLDEGPR